MHTDQEEVEQYLEDLRLVKPNEEWETDEIPMGRHKEHGKKVWCGLGAFDFETKTVIQFRRVWAWESSLQEVPTFKPGDVSLRFLWLTLPFSDEGRFVSACRHLKKYNTIPDKDSYVKFTT